MSTKISHSGVIESIDGGGVHVRIVQSSACAACKVAGYCNASESKEKIIDVSHSHAAKGLTVGQAVTVTTSGTVAARALMWGFGLPFILLVMVLVVALQLTGNEGMAALTALASLIPYYILLWLLRNRMREQLTFSIE